MTLPANQPVLAWPNLDLPQVRAVNTRTRTIDTPVSTGGNWGDLSTLTKEHRYQRVIRSASTAMADTQLVTDFQRPIKGSVFALPGHNMTPNVGWSLWRVRAATTNSFPANLVTSPDLITSGGGWAYSGTSASTGAAASYLGRDFTLLYGLNGGPITRTVAVAVDGTYRLSALVHWTGAVGVGHMFLYDSSIGAIRGGIEYTVAAGGVVTAVAAASSPQGNTTAVRATPVGGGVYELSALVHNCVAGFVNTVYASDSGNTTCTSIYMRRVTVENVPFGTNLVASPDALATGWTTGGGATATNADAMHSGHSLSLLSSMAGNVYRALGAMSVDGDKAVSTLIQADSGGAAGYNYFGLYDDIAQTFRALVQYTVIQPGGAITAVAQSGTGIGVEYLGDQVFRVSLTAPGCLAANSHTIYACAGGIGSTLTSVRMAQVSVTEAVSTIVIDSGWQNGFQPSHDADSFPSGVTVDSALAPTLDELLHMQGLSAVYVNPTVETFRYRKIEIDDTTNTDGFIDLTSFVGPGYCFPTGASVGASISWKDATTMEQNDFCIRRYNRQGKWRKCELTEGMLTPGQAIWPFRMEGRLGISEELFFALAPTLGNYVSDWSFLCTLAETSGVSFTARTYLDKGHDLVEKI